MPAPTNPNVQAAADKSAAVRTRAKHERMAAVLREAGYGVTPPNPKDGGRPVGTWTYLVSWAAPGGAIGATVVSLPAPLDSKEEIIGLQRRMQRDIRAGLIVTTFVPMKHSHEPCEFSETEFLQ